MSARTRAAHASDVDEREAGDLVAIRRNTWLSGVVGGLAAVLGVGFLLRGSGVLDTVVGANCSETPWRCAR